MYEFYCPLLTSCPSNGCQEDTVKAQRQSLLERKTLTQTNEIVIHKMEIM